jgi:hypothetical protein
MRKGICIKGHILNKETAYVRKDGGFTCKECATARRKRLYSIPTKRAEMLKSSNNYYQNNKEEIKKKNRNRWNKNKEKYNEQQRLSFPLKLRTLKIEVLTHYGNGKCICVCCGETILDFLTIDHINGRQIHERGKNRDKYSGRNLWRYLKREGFPSGYQTLCINCNMGKHINKGICPHKTMPKSKIPITVEWQS